jgi:hypothetical protein
MMVGGRFVLQLGPTRDYTAGRPSPAAPVVAEWIRIAASSEYLIASTFAGESRSPVRKMRNMTALVRMLRSGALTARRGLAQPAKK